MDFFVPVDLTLWLQLPDQQTKENVLGSEGAVKIMNRKDLAKSEDPESLKKQLIDEFTEKFANPYVAASNGTVDTVIDPAETRPMIDRKSVV